MALPEEAVATFCKGMIWVCPSIASVVREKPRTLAGIRNGQILLCDAEDTSRDLPPNVVELFGGTTRR